MKRIYLVRHGENTANITKELSHRVVDYSLTEKGVQQAAQTAEYFRSLPAPVDRIFSSPLKRARETAMIIGNHLNLPVIEDERLREVNVGSLETEGTLEDRWRLHHEVVDRWRAGEKTASFPDGEDHHQLENRFREAIERVLSETPSTAIVVGHGGIFRFAIDAIATWAIAEPIGRSENCSISTVEFADDLPGRVCSWAETTHLSGGAAEFVVGVMTRGQLQNPSGL